MTLIRPKYQIIPIVIPGAGQEVTLQFVTDKHWKRITGIKYVENTAAALPGTIFRRILIKGAEIFPDGFALKEIKPGDQVALGKPRWEPINEPAEGSTIDITVKDGGGAGVYPHTSWLYIMLEDMIDG